MPPLSEIIVDSVFASANLSKCCCRRRFWSSGFGGVCNSSAVLHNSYPCATADIPVPFLSPTSEHRLNMSFDNHARYTPHAASLGKHSDHHHHHNNLLICARLPLVPQGWWAVVLSTRLFLLPLGWLAPQRNGPLAPTMFTARAPRDLLHEGTADDHVDR